MLEIFSLLGIMQPTIIGKSHWALIFTMVPE
jgi:hypothetical protein